MTRGGRYSLYRGQGKVIEMTYRVHTSGRVEFFSGGFWQYSPVLPETVQKMFPLIAKNVRFKA